MRRVVWLAPLLAALGCGGPKPPPLTVKVAHAAAPDSGRCFPAGPRPTDDSLTSAHIELLRLSVRVHGQNDAQGAFRCDRLFQVPADQPTLQLDVTGEQSIDLYAEGFLKAAPDDPANDTIGPWRRVATGSLLNVDVGSTTLPPLRLYPVADFRCVDSRLQQARAFHTATTLPNGEVLIVGGLVADGADATREDLDPSGRLFVTGSVEVYDPSTGSFFALTEPTRQPRAFHQAVLLGDTLPYQILLTGGVTAGDASGQPQLLPNTTGTAQYAARFAPEMPGLVPTPLPTRAAGSEILIYDPFQKTIAHADAPAVPAAAMQGGAPLQNGLAVAGGIDWDASATPQLGQANKLYIERNGTVRAATLSAARVGATLTPLYGESALVWGGAFNLTATPPATPDPVGDFVDGISSTNPTVSAFVLPGVPMTLFHTATAFGSSGQSASVLVTGGFQVTAGFVALQPPATTSGLHVLAVASGGISVMPVALDGYVADAMCADPARYRPAGYESALLLPDRDGEVLVTGGSPRFDDSCNDCEDGQMQGPFCSLHQASLLRPPSTLGRLPALEVGRFGHTTSPLDDGTVLLVGGLTLPPGAASARAVADAEVYNPRQPEPRFDASKPLANDRDDPLAIELGQLGLVRAPGDVARDPAMGNAQAHACEDLPR
jgi:hypothetical protein